MVTADYYINEWGGRADGTERELKTLVSRAVDVIDNAIYLSGKTVAESTDSRVFKAVCAQADYILSCGGIDCMNENGGGSVSLGKFSYSEGSGGGSSASACTLCEQAREYLIPTGLLYKGVSVL